MVAYYHHDIAKWMDGTESLTDGEYRAYHVICQMIYLQNGPIVLHESGIAGRCNQHPLAFRSNLQKLFERGKLTRVADGKIANAKADLELQKIASRRRKPSADQAPTPPQPPQGSAGVQRGSSGGSVDKPLKNMTESLFKEGLEEEKKRKIPEEANASSANELDVRTRLFRSGLQTLIQITGRPTNPMRTLIGRWLRDANDDALKVLRAIEDAEVTRAADPVAWITRTIGVRTHSGTDRPTLNGRAALALRMMNRTAE